MIASNNPGRDAAVLGAISVFFYVFGALLLLGQLYDQPVASRVVSGFSAAVLTAIAAGSHAGAKAVRRGAKRD
jgi:hypothetical protein